MIKRLLIVLLVAAGIVFIPYLFGIWHWKLGAFDAEPDDPFFVKCIGGIGKLLIVLFIVITVSMIHSAIKYIIKG